MATYSQLFPNLATPKPQQKSNQRKTWLKLLPSALAVGGTLAAAPFTGGASLLGTAALLGGGAALGGAAGEAAAQKIGGEQTDVGKIGKEGLVSGATGAIPIGGAAKAAKVARIAGETVPETVVGQSAKDIPIKYIPSSAAGVGEQQTVNKLLVNPSVGAVSDAEKSLLQKGYKVSGQTRSYSVASTGRNTQQPVVAMTGQKTTVPLTGDEGIARTLQPKPQPINTQTIQVPKNTPVATSKGLIGKIRSSVGLHGQQMEARSGGYAVNAKQPGAKELDIGGSKAVGNTLSSEGIKTGSPIARLNMVEGKLKDYGGQIDQVLAKNNVVLSKEQRQQIADKYLSGLSSKMGTNDAVLKHAQNLADNFVKNGGKDAKGLIANKRQLDEDLINYIKNPDSALAHEQRAVVPFRQTLKEEANNLVPGLKQANDKYHDLSTAKGYLVKGSGEMNGRGGIVQRVAESGPIKTAEAFLGKGMQKAAGEARQTGGIVQRKLLNRAVREEGKQLIGHTIAAPAGVDGGVGSLLSSTASPPEDMPSEAAPTDAATQPAAGGGDLSAATDTTDDTQAQLDSAIKQALASGDTKGLDNLLKVADYYATQAKATKEKPLGSTQQQQANNAQSALQSLSDLSGFIKGDRGVVNKSGIPGQGSIVGGFESNLLGTGKYNTAASNIRDVISRLRSGAALTQQEEKRYTNMIPKAGDSDSVIQFKIGQLQDLFTKFASPQSSGGDLQDLLSQQGAY